MKAAILYNQRKPLSLEEAPQPVAGPNEILIQVKACGICHSDLHMVDGDWAFDQMPRILGHEIVGIVHAVGGQVSGFREGELVGMPRACRPRGVLGTRPSDGAADCFESARGD